MTGKEFEARAAETEMSRYQWREDPIYRLNGRGAMYYTGGENGIYMRINTEGKLEAGHYEGAIPHIGEAAFRPEVSRQFDSYSKAFSAAMEAGGKQFLVDMLSQEQPPIPEPVTPTVLPAAGENEMFYRNDESKLCVGYLRGDFGKAGKEFHHSWFDSGTGRNTPEFKAEFQDVMDTLRLSILKDHRTSEQCCHKHPDAELPNGSGNRYGFKLETEDRQYYIRCTTLRNDYFYIFAYDKAAPFLEQNRPATEKPSVLAQIREARKNPQPHAPKKDVGKNKSEPEL